MRGLPDRPRRRRPLLVRVAVGLVGGLVAGGLAVVAADRLHDAGPGGDAGPAHPALAYAEQQAARARLVTPTTGPAPSAAPAGSSAGGSVPPAAPLRYRFPVDGRATYGRTHHDYPAADMFARCGTAFVAPVDGTVEHLSRLDRWRATTNSGADRGGLSVALVGRDGVRYYGSHLRSVEPSLRVGLAVRAGTPLGRIGETGSAEGTGCHLHFGISPPCPQLRGADWWSRRGAVPPAPFLDAWRRGTASSPTGAVTAWTRAKGCPKAPTAYP